MLQSLRLEGENKMKKEVRKKPGLFATNLGLLSLFIQYPNGMVEILGTFSKDWRHFGYEELPLEQLSFLTKVSDL